MSSEERPSGAPPRASGGGSALTIDRAAFLLLRVKKAFKKKKNPRKDKGAVGGNQGAGCLVLVGGEKEDEGRRQEAGGGLRAGGAGKKGRTHPPPLLRSRTLPAIVVPGISILQAQIEARYAASKDASAKGSVSSSSSSSKKSGKDGSAGGGGLQAPRLRAPRISYPDEADSGKVPQGLCSPEVQTATGWCATPSSSHLLLTPGATTPGTAPPPHQFHTPSSASRLSAPGSGGSGGGGGSTTALYRLARLLNQRGSTGSQGSSGGSRAAAENPAHRRLSWERREAESTPSDRIPRSSSIDSVVELAWSNGVGSASSPRAESPSTSFAGQRCSSPLLVPPESTMSLLSPSVGRRIKGARLAIERSHPAGMEFLSDGLSRTKAGKKKVDKLNKINIHLHALFAAVEHGHVDKARTILESTDVDVNSVNGDGLSPLDIAVLHNDRPLAKTLLAFGAKEGQSYESQEALRMHLRHLMQDAESRVEALGGTLLIDPYDSHLHHHNHHHSHHNSSTTPAMAHGHHQQNHHRSHHHHHHHHNIQYNNEGGGGNTGDKQLLLWERRAKGVKKMLLGFDQARPPDEPFLVAVDVTGTNSLAVRFQEPENQDSAICTKFKGLSQSFGNQGGRLGLRIIGGPSRGCTDNEMQIVANLEWSCSEDFSPVIGEREVLRGVGGGGSSPALPSSSLVRGRSQGSSTSYIGGLGGFGPGDGDGRLASRWPLECHVTDLCQGQRYFFRVACGNLKGFGPCKMSSPSSVVPSSWRDIDLRSPRLAGRLQMLEDLFAQVRSSRPENASEIKGLEPSSSSSLLVGMGGGGGGGSGGGGIGGSGAGSGGDTPLPSRRNHRKKTTTSIKQLFTAASKFQKNLRRGIYLACLLYHEDKVLVTNEDFLPVIEVDEAYPNSIYGDFHWLMKVACTWDDVKSLKQDMDRCSGSTAVQFRSKLLQASAQMQTALCIQDLGQLHHRPIRDSQGTLVFSAVNCVRSPKAVSSGLNARWVPLSKVLQKQRLPIISPQGSYQQFNPSSIPMQSSSCPTAPPSSSTSSISSSGTTTSCTSTSSSNNPPSSSGYSSLCSATLLSSQQHYQASVQGSGTLGSSSIISSAIPQEGPNVGDMLMASIQEQIAYHQSCGVRLGRGLYLAYLKMRSSVDLIQVLVPMKTPNILPHCKIRDNPHVSAEEWSWLKRLSARHKGMKKERRWLFSPELEHQGDAMEGVGDSKELQGQDDSEADAGMLDEDMDEDDDEEGNETQKAFIQLVSATARRLLAYVEVGAEDALSHRLWDAEVVEVSSEVSLLVVVPPAETSCAAPGQKEALLRRPDLLPLPVQAFEVAHLSAYQREFICRYARLSSILEIDTIIAQHSHREAFSSAEVSAAKERLAQLTALSAQLNLAWQGARWLMDALTFARDRSPSSVGIPLHRLLQPPAPLLTQPALSILPPRRASSGGGEMSSSAGGGSSRASPLDGETGGSSGAGLLFLQLPKSDTGAAGSALALSKGKVSKKVVAAATTAPTAARWVPGVGMGGGLCGEHSKSEQQLHARTSQDSANASPASTVSDVGTRLPPSRSEDHLHHGRGRKGSAGGVGSSLGGEVARLGGMGGADMGWGGGPGLRAHSDSTLPLVKRAGRRVAANGVVQGGGLHQRPVAHRPYGSLLGVSDGAVGEVERVQGTASGSEETVSVSSDGAGCWVGAGADSAESNVSRVAGDGGERPPPAGRPLGEDFGVDSGEIVDLGEIDNDVDCEEEDDMVGSRGTVDDGGSELQVYAAYETGLAPGTSVRLHVTRETTAREVVDLVVQQLSMAAVLKGKSGPVYAGAQRLRSFCLVAVIGARERCLRDDFRPLLLQNPWRRGRLYIRMRHDLLAAIQHSSRHSAYL